MKLLEAWERLIDGIFGPLNALFRTNREGPLSLDDPSSMLSKPVVLAMPPIHAARTSIAVVRGPEDLTRAPDEGGKLEENVRYQAQIERGL